MNLPRMTRISLVVAITILSAQFAPSILGNVHATGSLFIDPANQPAQSIGSTVTFQVKVSGLALAGWDIAIQTDPNVLSPQSISIQNNILTGSVSELANCVNGGSGIPNGQPGDNRCALFDGQGVAHSAADGGFSSQTNSGLLFTITYQVVGDGFTQLRFIQEILAKGEPNPIDHTTFEASYGTLPGTPPAADFTWSPSQPKAGDAVTLDGSLSNDNSANQPSGITKYYWNFGDQHEFLTTTPQTRHVFADYTPGGGYGNFTVSLTVQDALGLFSRPTIHVVHVSPPAPAFIGVSGIDQRYEWVTAGDSITRSIGVTGISPLTVDLSSTVKMLPSGTPKNVPTVVLTPQTVQLTIEAGFRQTVGANVTIRTSPATTPGTYAVTVTGMSGGVTSSNTLYLIVAPYRLELNPVYLSIGAGSTGKVSVTVLSVGGYVGMVRFDGGFVGECFLVCKMTFSPNQTLVSPDHSGRTILTISVPKDVQPSLQTVIIRAIPVVLSASGFESLQYMFFEVPAKQPIITSVSWAKEIPSTNPTQHWTVNVKNPNAKAALIIRVEITIKAHHGEHKLPAIVIGSDLYVKPNSITTFDLTFHFNSSYTGLHLSFKTTLMYFTDTGGHVSSSTWRGSFSIMKLDEHSSEFNHNLDSRKLS